MGKVVMVLAIAVAALIAVALLLLTRVQRLESDVTTMRKTIADDEGFQRYQHDSAIKVETSDIGELRERTATIETWISRHTRTETRATSVVLRQAPTAASVPKSNWWCYLGRDCFRAREECSNGDDSRAGNCKPLDAAFCNQSGKCFGDLMACLQTIDVTVSTCTRSE